MSVLFACSSPAATATPIGVAPGVTALAVTSTPVPNPAPASTDAPALPTDFPQPALANPCANDATFLSDVSIPDGTQFRPGEPIDKIWTLQNTGTCDWGPDYRFVLVNGDAMGAPAEMALYPAASGAVAAIRVQMTAPAEPGERMGRWQARAPDGTLFGSVVFIKIEVVP